jgi:small subunit ribosomal protein S4
VSLLERRLDAVVLRAGLARTIYQARQFVTHRHIAVNGRRVDKPSYRTRPGDVVAVVERSRTLDPFVVAAAGGNATDGAPVPYLAPNLGALTVLVERLPERREIPVRCDEQLVVEYYSR